MEECIIFDIDGTLCDLSHRLPLKKSKKLFHLSCINDKPKFEIIALYKSLSKNYKIVGISCRPEFSRSQTLKWLNYYNIFFDELFLRDDNDTRNDAEIKFDFLNELKLKYKILFAVDDRQSVVDMFRKNGVTCLQVDYGDF